MEHPLEFSLVNVMNMQSFMDKFSKMSIFRIKRQQIPTFVMCDMVKTSWDYTFSNSIVCDLFL